MREKHPSYSRFIPPVSFDIILKTIFTEGFDQYTELKNLISETDNLRDIKQKNKSGKRLFAQRLVDEGLDPVQFPVGSLMWLKLSRCLITSLDQGQTAQHVVENQTYKMPAIIV